MRTVAVYDLPLEPGTELDNVPTWHTLPGGGGRGERGAAGRGPGAVDGEGDARG